MWKMSGKIDKNINSLFQKHMNKIQLVFLWTVFHSFVWLLEALCTVYIYLCPRKTKTVLWLSFIVIHEFLLHFPFLTYACSPSSPSWAQALLDNRRGWSQIFFRTVKATRGDFFVISNCTDSNDHIYSKSM